MNNNIYDNIEIQVTEKKESFTDKALDFLIGVGEEIESHPARAIGTGLLAAFCYGRGKKKGYKAGSKDELNYLRRSTMYRNEDEESCLLGNILAGNIKYIHIFTKDEKNEYDACSNLRDSIREAEKTGESMKVAFDITK